MGGIGHHHVHPYALQVAAFFFSMLLPGGVLFLLAGAWFESMRREIWRPKREAAPAQLLAHLDTLTE